jgi:serine/threonine protein kinase
LPLFYEEGAIDGHHYIAMKYIRGGTLKGLIEREGTLPVARAATILTQVGSALDYAHRKGVIHRDVKPSNILLSEEGWAYLSDFGLARGAPGLTMAGTVMGTPEYMSPEQAQGLDSVGPPTDIYALGVVLYELLTGAFPFQADTPMAMLAARIVHAPTPIGDLRRDLPVAVEDVVMRALARRPDARFASAGAMVDDCAAPPRSTRCTRGNRRSARRRACRPWAKRSKCRRHPRPCKHLSPRPNRRQAHRSPHPAVGASHPAVGASHPAVGASHPAVGASHPATMDDQSRV